MARLEVLRRLRLHPLVVDSLIAVSFAIFGIVGMSGLSLDLATIQRTWPLIPIILAGTLPLALRRVMPLVPLIAIIGAGIALNYYHYEPGGLVLVILVATYSVGAHSRSQRSEERRVGKECRL